ncbi:hypothetical protein RFI_13810, partial [Reticulomyxa filosa]
VIYTAVLYCFVSKHGRNQQDKQTNTTLCIVQESTPNKSVKEQDREEAKKQPGSKIEIEMENSSEHNSALVSKSIKVIESPVNDLESKKVVTAQSQAVDSVRGSTASSNAQCTEFCLFVLKIVKTKSVVEPVSKDKIWTAQNSVKSNVSNEKELKDINEPIESDSALHQNINDKANTCIPIETNTKPSTVSATTDLKEQDLKKHKSKKQSSKMHFQILDTNESFEDSLEKTTEKCLEAEVDAENVKKSESEICTSDISSANSHKQILLLTNLKKSTTTLNTEKVGQVSLLEQNAEKQNPSTNIENTLDAKSTEQKQGLSRRMVSFKRLLGFENKTNESSVDSKNKKKVENTALSTQDVTSEKDEDSPAKQSAGKTVIATNQKIPSLEPANIPSFKPIVSELALLYPNDFGFEDSQSLQNEEPLHKIEAHVDLQIDENDSEDEFNY